jgi:glycosyltransferase involved in cell wall biosynthesis
MVEPLPTPQPSITVSIVVPVFSGEAFLRDLTGEVERLRRRWIEAGSLLAVGELIFVDDAAIDRSPELLDQIAEEKSWVRVCICRGISARMLRPTRASCTAPATGS